MTEKEYKKYLKDALIKYRVSLKLPKEVTFGVEIEYENIPKETVSYLMNEEKEFEKNLIGWHNKTELDIGEYNNLGEEMNGEITSPILKDNIATWKNLKIALDLLIRNEAIITEKCGAHINIGAHILGTKKQYWRNFFLLWMLYEKEIYKFSKGDYLKLRPDKDKILERITSEIIKENIIKISNKNYLNNLGNVIFSKCNDVRITKNLDKKVLLGNVIEFRIPNGTLEKEIWQNYINFFAKFVIACKKDLDVEKVLYKINNNEHNAIELADLVFDNDMDKEYFLIQTLKTNEMYKKELIKHKTYC